MINYVSTRQCFKQNIITYNNERAHDLVSLHKYFSTGLAFKIYFHVKTDLLTGDLYFWKFEYASLDQTEHDAADVRIDVRLVLNYTSSQVYYVGRGRVRIQQRFSSLHHIDDRIVRQIVIHFRCRVCR